MTRYLIECESYDARDLTHAQLVDLARTWNEAVGSLGVPYTWVTSYVVDNRIICIHEAEDDEAVREHARRIGFTPSRIIEVTHQFGPETARESTHRTAHQVGGPRTSVGS